MRRPGLSWTTALSLLLTLLGALLALPSGAPESVCRSMLPLHSGLRKFNGSDSPYRLVQEKAAFTLTNPWPAMTLYTKNSLFKGFLVRAIDEQGNDIGHFLRLTGYKNVRGCTDVTHKSRNNKRTVKMIWQAPHHGSGRVTFKATVVQEYRRVYADLKSTLK
ncbi:putative defense protein 3 [Dermacentor albipictus]|uniref:putative defense protein 3 n=1 Tax=Dermacentor albipictus TaxID=60249 RepID=UPI0038FCCDF8